WRRDRAGWMTDDARPFVAPDTSQAMLDWLMDLMLGSSLRVWLACNEAFASQDQSEELRALRLPTLVIHGDADASAPLDLTGRRTAALVPGAALKVYAGAPHALFVTHLEQLNADVSAFVGAGG
ncbi:MAG TPA: alpha/beta hydrolase, partial [Caulobacteraceae bacterium]|nr:alpha/beta hydrolase [Caulobacteraceae bacterium]